MDEDKEKQSINKWRKPEGMKYNVYIPILIYIDKILLLWKREDHSNGYSRLSDEINYTFHWAEKSNKAALNDERTHHHQLTEQREYNIYFFDF